MRNGSILWGIGLVLLGGLLLLQNLGLIPRGINVWAIFWSLVLILVGVNLLLRATGRGGRLEVVEIREPLDGARQAELRFHHGAGELLIDGRAPADVLYEGAFEGGVDADARRGADTVQVDLRARVDNIPVFGGANWRVSLNPTLPLALRFELGAGRYQIDLRDLQVKELSLNTGASSAEIELPARAGSTRATVRSGAASVNLRVPQGVAARIRAKGGLASIDVDTLRFPRLGDEYVSSDYETAANRVDIDVETGVGAVEVR